MHGQNHIKYVTPVTAARHITVVYLTTHVLNMEVKIKLHKLPLMTNTKTLFTLTTPSGLRMCNFHN